MSLSVRTGATGTAFRRAANRDDAQQVVPGAVWADLDDVGGELIGSAVQRRQLPPIGDASPERWQPGAEDVGDEHELVIGADRAIDRRRLTDLATGAHQLRMGIADLLAGEAAAAVLVDQVLAGKPMIDDAGRRAGAARRSPQRPRPKRHRARLSTAAGHDHGRLCRRRRVGGAGAPSVRAGQRRATLW